MTKLARNGIGGLGVRLIAIALAALAFGCAPTQPATANTDMAASETRAG